MKIVTQLLEKGAIVNCHDPIALETAKKVMPLTVSFHEKIENTISQADACIIVTSWEEYKKLNSEFFKKHMKQAIVFDCRRIFKPNEFNDIEYLGIGKST